jgi:membrane fusion protein (multidrug efflux system)
MSDVKSRKFLLRLVLLIVIPAVAISIGGYFYLIGGRYISTENAYVKAHIVQITTVLDGRVTDVAVRDHTTVSRGDMLFQIDPAPHEIALEKAEAELDGVRTTIETLRAAYEEAKAEIGENEADIAYKERQVDRQTQLRKRGVTSRDHADRASSDLLMAQERHSAARLKMQRTLTALGGDANIDPIDHPLYKRKLAEVRQAEMDLQNSTIVAPADGIITNMKLQMGEYVEEGRPVFSLIATGQPWIEANLKETDLTYIKVGQRAKVVIDAYPDREFEAEVASISPATGAEFAVLPPQNATGNWVKVVQRLPVKLVLSDADSKKAPLRAGMTVSVSIDTKHRRPALLALQRTMDGSAHADD